MYILSRTKTLCMVLGTLLVIGTTVSAQSSDEATDSSSSSTAATADSSGWGVQCNNTANGLQCAASMSVVSTPDNQRIFSISFREASENDTPTMVMLLPFGLNLPRGVDLVIDGGDALNFAINTCLQTGCFVVQPAQASLIEAMRTGNSLTVVMEASNGSETRMNLSLTGFTAAMNRLN